MDSQLEPRSDTSLSGTSDDALRVRIDALADEAWPIRFSERARAESLAREALRLAETAEYPAGVALAVRTLAAQQFYFHSDYDPAPKHSCDAPSTCWTRRKRCAAGRTFSRP